MSTNAQAICHHYGHDWSNWGPWIPVLPAFKPMPATTTAPMSEKIKFDAYHERNCQRCGSVEQEDMK